MPNLEPAFQTALALHRAGNLAVAAQHYRDMLAIDPTYAKAWHLLGLTHFQSGDGVTAVEYIRRAIELRGDNAVYHGNLGLIYRTFGRLLEAHAELERALELDPEFTDARVNIGNTLTALCRGELAMPQFQAVIEKHPENVEARVGLAHTLGELGEAEAARREYQVAQRLQPSPTFQVLGATQLPPVYRSNEEMHFWRERLESEVDQLLADGVKVDLSTAGAMPVFSLAHQGMNDVVIARKLARLHKPPAEEFSSNRIAAARGKIHVGFISSFFRDHTIGKLMRGFIAHLNRDEFYVTVLSLGHHDDETARLIQSAADRYLPLTTDANVSRRVITEAGLDILFYTDIGMDPTTYTLAFSRLAPVQCVSWGHPDTTGLDTIDYFVSSELFESSGADEHYHEKLVRLPSLPLYYYPPAIPESLKPRQFLELEEDAHLYCCPQSIYKFHPDFDPVIAEILRRDPKGQLVMIKWMYPLPDELLLERWRRTMGDVVDRVRFVCRLSQLDFMNLLAVSDVLVDPVRFGGGNTSAEALALGTPIVTLPDEFMRSRITAAFFRQMGLDDLIASSPAQYVEQAVALGTDPGYRRQYRERILAAHGRLYEDLAAVRSLENFFRQAVGKD